MAPTRKTSRRDFLRGRSVVDAVIDLADAAPAAELAAAPPPAHDSYLLHVGRRAMACQFEVLLNAGQYAHGTQAALAALDHVDELEAQLTVYRDDSEIMAVNSRASGEPVEVEPGLFALLQEAVDVYRATAGAFDITAGPLSRVWGFDRRNPAVPDARALAAARARVGTSHLMLDAAGRTVRFLIGDMEINLGGIGKGYALDRAAAVLVEAGLDHFMLHGGKSSVLARGSRGAEEGWDVGVSHPRLPTRRLAEICLRDRALSTSGTARQFFRHGGRRYGHIIDPRTGWPAASGVHSATVVAPTAARADALSTAFYILGPQAAADYCTAHPDTSVLLLTEADSGRASRMQAFGFDEGELRLSEVSDVLSRK